MYKKPFLRLFALFVAFSWFTLFSKAILPTHFLQEGLSLSQIMLGTLLTFIGQTCLILVTPKLSAKTSWRMAMTCWFIYILLVITIQNSLQFYVASIVGGFMLFLFYVFYNIAHFEKTPKEAKGHSSALIFVIPTLIGIIAPLIAGYLSQVDIWLSWTICVISFFIALYTINFQENFTIHFNLIASLREIRATRLLLIVEGIWEALVIGIIPIYTLFFIQTPFGYGAFLSYVAIVGIIANLSLGKLTDKLQKRAVFLYPLTIIMAAITLLFPYTTQDVTLWIAATSSIMFLLPLFWNVTTALFADSHPNLRVAIPGREISLAVGRVIGLLLAFASFSYEKSPNVIFTILSLVLLLYPVILYWNMHVSKQHKYM